MKYLRRFKIFESNDKNIKDTLVHIFSDLEDQGIDVNIECKYIKRYDENTKLYNKLELDQFIIEISTGLSYKEETPSGLIRIGVVKDSKSFELKDLYENILLSREYLSFEDFYIRSVKAGPQAATDTMTSALGYIGNESLFDFELYERGIGRFINKPLNFIQLVFKKI
jgi:hypothetical protein